MVLIGSAVYVYELQKLGIFNFGPFCLLDQSLSRLVELVGWSKGNSVLGDMYWETQPSSIQRLSSPISPCLSVRPFVAPRDIFNYRHYMMF